MTWEEVVRRFGALERNEIGLICLQAVGINLFLTTLLDDDGLVHAILGVRARLLLPDGRTDSQDRMDHQIEAKGGRLTFGEGNRPAETASDWIFDG